MADIGPVRRKIEFEPMPETAPVEEPISVPERAPEKVPA